MFVQERYCVCMTMLYMRCGTPEHMYTHQSKYGMRETLTSTDGVEDSLGAQCSLAAGGIRCADAHADGDADGGNQDEDNCKGAVFLPAKICPHEG